MPTNVKPPSDGWMPGIEYAPIAWQPKSGVEQSTFGANNQPIAIVDHIMQGYQSTMIAWAESKTPDRRVAVHFTISMKGRIVQHLPVNRCGIHAGLARNPSWALYKGFNPNLYTIGIEHEGCSVEPRGYGVPQSIIWSPSNPWPEPMKEASLRVKRWCFDNVPSLGRPSAQSIIGHYEIDSISRADDPESPEDRIRGVWPRDWFIEQLEGDAIRAGDPVSWDLTIRKGWETADPGRLIIALFHNKVRPYEYVEYNGRVWPAFVVLE